ncbi:MAG TPA: neutral zinc metallopeptidase [Catenuloplanes sp.]|jgi:hypothetical protein
MHIPLGAARLTRLGALAVALLAGACAIVPSSARTDGDGRADTAVSGQASPVEPAADGTDTAAEFERDIAGAERIARDYWARQLAGSGQRFKPIRRVVAYQREGELTCGDQPLGLNNAAYCSAGDFIAYDANWAFGAFRKIGDAFLFYLLGHEYAHGIQARLGIRSKFTVQQELQADCMAGAYIGDSERAGTLKIRTGDLEEFRNGLLAVGDDPGQPWFANNAHGTAEQRSAAFLNGYQKSLAVCELG